MKIAKNIFLLSSVVSDQDCDTLVDSIEDRWWDLGPEPVDGLPLWQTKAMGRHQCPEVLYQFSRMLAITTLIDKIHELTGFSKAKLLSSEFWPFMRKYQTGNKGRDSFKLHPDPTYFTAIILLTDPSEFEGGNFIIKKSLFKAAQPVKMKKGDCVIFKGSKKHGVEKLTKGVRHSLNMFFWDSDDEIKVYLQD